MIQSEHRVGLTAAEIGLKLNNRIPTLARDALNRGYQQASEALGEVCAAEKLHRIPVLVCALAQVHLPEVCSKLGLLVAAARHVLVWCDHFPPGLQVSRSLALDCYPRALTFLAPHLLVKAKTQKLHLHFLDLVRLRCGNGGKQASGRIKRSVGVVGRKGGLVRPLVASLPQFTH